MTFRDRSLLGPGLLLLGSGASAVSVFLESIVPPVIFGLAGFSLMLAGACLTVAAFLPSDLVNKTPLAAMRKWTDQAPTSPSQVGEQSTLRADWPIRELFFHIKPNVLNEERGERLWKEVGHAIKAAHANGDLIIWATPMPKDWLEENYFPEDRRAPVRLRNDYWQDGDFTWAFFADDGAPFRSHCEISSGALKPSESYCDLRVNQRQVLALWPGEFGKDQAAGGVPVWRTCEMLAERFGWSQQQAADAIESAASLGLIKVMGREMGSGKPPLKHLDKNVWSDHYLSVHVQQGDMRAQTFAKSKRFQASSYYDLRVFESEVCKIITKNSGLERDRG